jgi:hypothetical protein
MFIACRGIPVLVGFLEADYAKYRLVIFIKCDYVELYFMLDYSLQCYGYAKMWYYNRNGMDLSDAIFGKEIIRFGIILKALLRDECLMLHISCSIII